MKKINDKQVMAICASVTVLTGSMLAGGIAGYHQSEATREYINAESNLEENRARQHGNFWNLMRIIAGITSACAGYAAGLLIKDAFNIGKH